MDSKQLMLAAIQQTLADQAEVGHEFLSLSRVSAMAFLATAEF
jgi:hypothetical protein